MILALTIALQPDVLLLDESLSALDEATMQLVEATLIDLEIALVLVSHSDAQLGRFCDQILTVKAAGRSLASWCVDLPSAREARVARER